jgi:hypothetical protein
MAGTIPVALAVTTLLAAPSLVTVGLYKVTGDPSLRPMSITEEKVAATDFATGGDVVRIRIYWRGAAEGFGTASDLADALRRAFDSKGVDSMIAVMQMNDRGVTMLDMRAGAMHYGPFPVADAARHVSPAAAAVSYGRGGNSGGGYLWGN